MDVPPSCQQTVLPWEITDAIIDNLHDDIEALGACGAVCSQWLIRSRHHMFATLQLWPWRVEEFFELASSPLCTFVTHTKRLEVDDMKRQARSRSRSNDSRKHSSRSCSSHQTPNVIGMPWAHETDGSLSPESRIPFRDTLLIHQPPACFDNIESLLIRNVDWTVLPTNEQSNIRGRLAKFSSVYRLELQDVTFHDLREVTRIVDVLPDVRHLTANISFLKYLEQTVASALTLSLSRNLQSVELGTEDGLPVVLSCITGASSHDGPDFVKMLMLKNVKPKHHQYVKKMLGQAGRNLQQLGITFAEEKTPWVGEGMFACIRVLPMLTGLCAFLDQFASTIDLSRLSALHTLRLKGLHVPKASRSSVLEECLPAILQRIESSFLDTIHLGFVLGPGADLRHIDWRQLERVFLTLHFFGLRRVEVVVEVIPGAISSTREVKTKIHLAMPELVNRGVLDVSADASRTSITENRVGRR